MVACPKKLGRRELGRGALGLGAAFFAQAAGVTSLASLTSAAGCGGARSSPGHGASSDAPRIATALGSHREGRAALRGEVEVWSCFDLPPTDPRSRELSGVTFDAASGTFFAVQDELGAIVPLRPDAEMKTWSFGEAIRLDVQGPLDLEGVAVTADGFVVSSEIGPRLVEVDRAGRYRRDLAAPEKFHEAVRNKSFESLALDPSRRVLYTTSETALPRDERATGDGFGPRVRILRLDLAAGTFVEHAYATDAVVTGGGDYGVSDMTALATDDLLVLERGFRKGVGNEVRIYRVDLTDTTSVCSGVDRLTSSAVVLEKTLLVDLSKLAPKNASAPRQPQETPLMENYEGMTIGPRLPDGRLSLVLVSDDNGRPVQTPRVLTLAVR